MLRPSRHPLKLGPVLRQQYLTTRTAPRRLQPNMHLVANLRSATLTGASLHRIRLYSTTTVHSLDILVDPRVISQPKRNEKSKKSNKPSYRFVDRVRVQVSGGAGGKGSLSSEQMRRRHHLRPDGGHGGHGGQVLLVADPREQTLSWTHPHAQAEKGTNGSSKECSGRNGENLIIRVPCGVVVKRILDPGDEWDDERKLVNRPSWSSVQQANMVEEEKDSRVWDEAGTKRESENGDLSDSEDDDDEEGERDLRLLQQGFEIEVTPDGSADELAGNEESLTDSVRRTVVIADLDEPGSYALVARGGQGGIGSSYYASAQGPTPDAKILIRKAKPEPGEIAFLELELKLIADIGLVGFPNAGKSSLLHAMSRASPEIAPYPFTTLHPLIGCIEYQDGYRIRAADIPGLIEGASEGRGCGHAFLRHIERTKALLYIVDAAGTDFRDPAEDLKILAKELESYGDGSLLERRALVVANKLDLLTEEQAFEILEALGQAAKEAGINCEQNVLGISAGVSGQGLGPLSREIRNIVTKSEADRQYEFEQNDQILTT